MKVNRPETLAEVTKAFFAYEKALVDNNVEMINSLFWNDIKTLRYGSNGTLIGHNVLSEFRRARKTVGVRRDLKNTSIVTFGDDFAIANTEAHDESVDGTVRQSQTWVRIEGSWKIVSAHLSSFKESELK